MVEERDTLSCKVKIEETAMSVDLPSPNQSDPEGTHQLSAGSACGETSDLTPQVAETPSTVVPAPQTSTRKRKKPYSFETNPSMRVRHRDRLLRKLRLTLDEYTMRIGQQAVVLVANPKKPNLDYTVFGANPLKNVIQKMSKTIKEELENALADHTPSAKPDPSLFELPPLIMDGMPIPLEKMSQAQLRAFIPLMLKYSTGRGKPGWGRDSMRPPWWPKQLPWANVRLDTRSDVDKEKLSWTHVLRQVVANCYKYHGREDLLPTDPNEELIRAFTGSDSGCGSTIVKLDPLKLTDFTENSDSDCVTIIEKPHDLLNDTTLFPETSEVTTIENVQGKSIPIHTIPAIPENVDSIAIGTAWLTEGIIGPYGEIFLTGANGGIHGVLQVPESYNVVLANNSVCVTPIPTCSHSLAENFKIVGVTSNDLTSVSMVHSPDCDASQIRKFVLSSDGNLIEVNGN